jgi:hypothetical protein
MQFSGTTTVIRTASLTQDESERPIEGPEGVKWELRLIYF